VIASIKVLALVYAHGGFARIQMHASNSPVLVTRMELCCYPVALNVSVGHVLMISVPLTEYAQTMQFVRPTVEQPLMRIQVRTLGLSISLDSI
jgi:hypothetical protein